MKKLFSLMLIVTTLASCSGPMQWIIEGQIDRLIANRMAKSLHLYWGQERELYEEIPAIRLSLAPEINLLKTQIHSFLKDPELLDDKGSILYQAWQQASLKLNPILAKWMAKLDQKQVEKLFNQLDVENKKLKNEIDQPEDSMFLRRFELVFGELNESQKTLILQNKEMSLRPYQRRLERRLKSREFLSTLYAQEKTQAALEHEITVFFNSLTQEAAPKDEWDFQQTLIKQVLDSINQDQQDHLVKQLNRFVWLLDTLIEQ